MTQSADCAACGYPHEGFCSVALVDNAGVVQDSCAYGNQIATYRSVEELAMSNPYLLPGRHNRAEVQPLCLFTRVDRDSRVMLVGARERALVACGCPSA